MAFGSFSNHLLSVFIVALIKRFQMREGEISSAELKMGHRHFGNLAKVRRLVYFGISPFEQRSFPNYFSKGIPNTLRRMKRQLFLIVPPVYTAFYLIKWSREENNRFSRKNPADYAADE